MRVEVLQEVQQVQHHGGKFLPTVVRTGESGQLQVGSLQAVQNPGKFSLHEASSLRCLLWTGRRGWLEKYLQMERLQRLRGMPEEQDVDGAHNPDCAGEGR
mmetsp:Transcript_138058/g.243487  ORF Transcript_138058/g.243487 Transcript_138058/m.243487 type:complete len:101 (+) Transcript_138058:1231-1533(+)